MAEDREISAAAVAHTVTGRAGAGGMIVFIVKPNTGFLINAVMGCNGKLSGTTYTTGLITGQCAVNATTLRVKSKVVSK